MPIRPENRARYPKDWPGISRQVRDHAGNRCEGSPAYPECRAENGRPHPVTGSSVVLTVAHLDHRPENVARSNLRAWCQRCHNTYDLPMRRAGIAARAKGATPHPCSDVFDTGPDGPETDCQGSADGARGQGASVSDQWLRRRFGPDGPDGPSSAGFHVRARGDGE